MLAEGQVLGNYRIVRKLGEGGMGAVFEAVHQEIGRRAAVKVLHPQFAQNAQVATRFLNEAKAANLIEHPGVVEIFEFSRLPDGTTYIVMEFLKGESLAKRLERGPLGLDTLRIARQIASVLAAAHENGIIHRDLKPDNVFIVRDPEAPGGERAKVLDFGIAKIAEEHTMKTQAGSVLGTPAYMAPEQCKGAALVTDKSDVYALGIMMYEMLCGHVPFRGTGLGDIMVAHLTQEPSPLRDVTPDVSPELAAYVHRLLAKDPAMRPTMKEVIAQIERFGASRTGMMTVPVEDDPTKRKTIGFDAPPPSTSQPKYEQPPESPQPRPALPVPDTGEKERTRKLLFAGLGIAGVVIVVCVGLLLRAPGKKPGHPPKERVAPADLGTKKELGADTKPDPDRPKVPPPAGMSLVPGGSFAMGSTKAEIDAAMDLCKTRGTACNIAIYEREQPKHTVRVHDLFVDNTEVNTAEFVAWLNEQRDLKVQKKRYVYAGKTMLVDLDPNWSGIESGNSGKAGGFKVRDGYAQKPMVLVSWSAARLYCIAKGKRLPTEAEWELAARGKERRTFPWGEEPPKCEGTVFGHGSDLPKERQCVSKDTERGPHDVGTSSQDRTPQGVLDLGGNVAEWVEDIFSEKYPDCGDCKNPVNHEQSAGDAEKSGKKAKGAKDTAALRVVRGGHFDLPADASRGAGRSKLAEGMVTFKLGFRCVKSLAE